jgi:hypothetical protein
MASRSGQVTLRGRFSVGSVVTLTKVAGEHVAGGGRRGRRDEDGGEEDGAPRVGFVRFSKGVEPGRGTSFTGSTTGCRCRSGCGPEADDPSEVLEQAPILPDRTRMSDGSWSDEAPTKESAPDVLAAQADLRHVRTGCSSGRTRRGGRRIRSIRTSRSRCVGRRTCRRARRRCRTRGRVRSTVCRVGGGGEATELLSARSGRRTCRRACSSGRRRRRGRRSLSRPVTRCAGGARESSSRRASRAATGRVPGRSRSRRRA